MYFNATSRSAANQKRADPRHTKVGAKSIRVNPDAQVRVYP
jgi:hypothetical protein